MSFSVNVKFGTEQSMIFANDEAPVGPQEHFVNREAVQSYWQALLEHNWNADA